MQYANVNGERREASSNAKGECPVCGGEVISKCGNIKIHHWAHVSGSGECESGKEPESKEHRVFKEQFPEWCREVVHGSRRADVLVGRFVVECKNRIYLSRICLKGLKIGILLDTRYFGF